MKENRQNFSKEPQNSFKKKKNNNLSRNNYNNYYDEDFDFESVEKIKRKKSKDWR